VFGVIALLVMLQPNLGTTIVLAGIVLAVLFVAGTPLAPLTGLATLAGILAAALACGRPTAGPGAGLPRPLGRLPTPATRTSSRWSAVPGGITGHRPR
jgi:cell division protein FtsW (lipid II flippase)